MRDSVFKPKIMLNPDYGSEEKVIPLIRLDSNHQRNVSEPSPKHGLYPKIKFHDIKTPLAADSEIDFSMDYEYMSPSSRVILPLTITSTTKISTPSHMYSSKGDTAAFIKTPSHLQGARRPTQDKFSMNFSGDPRNDTRRKSTFTKYTASHGLASERQERSKDLDESPTTTPKIQSARGDGKKLHKPTKASVFGSQDRCATEGFEESAYEKANEVLKVGRMYSKKLTAINFAEMRKSSVDMSKDSYRSETESPTGSPVLRTRQASEVVFVKRDQESIFKKYAGDTNRQWDFKPDTIGDDFEVLPNQSNHLTLEKLKFSYCYISVMGKNCPLTISIQGAKEIKKVRVFVSMVHKKPTKLNCNYEFDTRYFKLFDKDKNSAKFMNPYFYFAIYPDESGTVNIKAEFEPLKEIVSSTMRNWNPTRPVNARKKKSIFELPKNLDSISIYEEIEKIKKERKERIMQLANGIDKVELNKNIEQYLPSTTNQKREMIRHKSEELFKTVQSRKLVVEQEKSEAKKASAMKRDIQKMAKEMAQKEQKKIKQKQNCLRIWVMNMFLCNLGISMKQMINSHKRSIAQQLRMMTVLTRFARKMKKSLRSKADGVENRMNLDIRMALQFQANVLLAARRPEVERIVIDFLQENMNIQFLKDKFMNSFHAIRKAQGSFRDYMKRKEGFKTCLLVLWEKNYPKVHDDIMNPVSPTGTSEERQEAVKRLKNQDMSTNENAKRKFIKMWFKQCLEKYKRNFDVHNSEVFKLDSETKHKWLQQYVFQTGEKKEEPFNVKHMRRISKGSLMEEFQRNRLINIDYTSKTMKAEDKLVPPKLFFLPTQEELEALMKTVLLTQNE